MGLLKYINAILVSIVIIGVVIFFIAPSLKYSVSEETEKPQYELAYTAGTNNYDTVTDNESYSKQLDQELQAIRQEIQLAEYKQKLLKKHKKQRGLSLLSPSLFPKREVIKKKIREKQELAGPHAQDLTSPSKDLSHLILPQQKRGSNACVVENINFMLNFMYKKELDIPAVYSAMGKKVGDLWSPGELKDDKVKGGYWKVYEQARDYNKFSELTNIRLIQSADSLFMKRLLQRENTVVFLELPLSVLYPRDTKWKKPQNQTLYHAITIISYDQANNSIAYLNTLSGRIETLPLSRLTKKDNTRYLIYPFRYIHNKSAEDMNSKYLKDI